MKIFSIIIFEKKNNEITIKEEEYEIKDISFFYRNETKEFLRFISKTMASNISNQKVAVTEKEYVIYITRTNNNITVAVTDKEYPQRIAFSMIEKINNDINTVNLKKEIEKYQNPNEADQILKIQKNIDDTKSIMIDTIDKALERGEKIDELIAKSDDLSATSKNFYKESKKMNSWCAGCTIQ